MFQKHPGVGVCNADPAISNWEPNFWNLGARAIQGKTKKFIERFEQSHPFLKFPHSFTEESVFRLWDNILEELGPVIFDKSPQYLGNRDALNLLKNYIGAGNDVRLFAMIRDPRDAITSQYELWKSHVPDYSPKIKEEQWLSKYQHLEELQNSSMNIPQFRYEDFASAPACYAPMIFRHCDIAHVAETYDHIKPTSLGRYSASLSPAIRLWKFSDEFVRHLRKYGYKVPQLTALEKADARVRMFKGNVYRELQSVKTNVKNRLEVLSR